MKTQQEVTSVSSRYTVESWYVSGVRTGYRVMRGRVAIRGFAADWKQDGDFELARASAETLCDVLNISQT